jgi:hypothetical protein
MRPAEAAAASTVDLPLTAAAGSLWEGRHLALLRVDLLPPATAGPLLDPARTLDVIADKIRSFGGCIQELGATMIVGAFGLEPIENAASNAALAALAIQNAAERARRVDSRVPAVKVAVHTGQLLVGRVDGRAQIDLEDKRATELILAGLSDVGQSNSIVVSAAAAPFLERRFELARESRRIDAELLEDRGNDPFALAQQNEKEVIRREFGVPASAGIRLCFLDGLLGLDGQLVEAHRTAGIYYMRGLLSSFNGYVVESAQRSLWLPPGIRLSLEGIL